MCDIVTALAVGSSLLGGASAIQQGQAQAKASRYNAKVSEMNAAISQRQANDALERGAREEQQQRRKTAQLMGRQQAAMGANGVDLSFGSPLDMIVDSATLGELDALTIRRNTANEAYDFETRAANGRADAAMSRATAKSASAGGFLTAAGTVLGGTSDAIGKYNARKAGSGLKVPA